MSLNKYPCGIFALSIAVSLLKSVDLKTYTQSLVRSLRHDGTNTLILPRCNVKVQSDILVAMDSSIKDITTIANTIKTTILYLSHIDLI